MNNAVLRKKDYPLNYPTEITNIIEAMSFSKGTEVDIVGSMSLKSQQYAGDYDMFETVNTKYASDKIAVSHLVKQFQEIVEKLQKMKNVYIADIKAGEIAEWNVMRDGVSNAPRHIKQLLDDGIISKADYKEVQSVLKTKDENEMYKAFKFHIVRWTPVDIKKGECVLRDGRTYTLEEAFQSPAIVKLDVVALVQNNRYTDFSIIYKFKNKNKTLNNFNTGNEVDDIKRDLKYYYEQGNYFKAIKRLFSIARIEKNNKKLISKLNTLLNGDLGRIYGVLSDIGTLQYIVDNEDNIPKERILYELDQFRARLGNVYSLNAPNKVLKKIVETTPRTKEQIEHLLEEIGSELETILSTETKKRAEASGVFPISHKYLTIA